MNLNTEYQFNTNRTRWFWTWDWNELNLNKHFHSIRRLPLLILTFVLGFRLSNLISFFLFFIFFIYSVCCGFERFGVTVFWIWTFFSFYISNHLHKNRNDSSAKRRKKIVPFTHSNNWYTKQNNSCRFNRWRKKTTTDFP